ncbi:hypothetical protein C8R47DRAFT_1221678 [Mycena vitilis]|nr:hypothetical protein C8R47DRAFT_1221678 [Mycena vitilis]
MYRQFLRIKRSALHMRVKKEVGRLRKKARGAQWRCIIVPAHAELRRDQPSDQLQSSIILSSPPLLLLRGRSPILERSGFAYASLLAITHPGNLAVANHAAARATALVAVSRVIRVASESSPVGYANVSFMSAKRKATGVLQDDDTRSKRVRNAPSPPAHLVSAEPTAEARGTLATTDQSGQWRKPADALQIQRGAHIAKLHGAGVELIKARRELKSKDKDQQQALRELNAKNKELRAAIDLAVQTAAPKAAALEASIIAVPRAAAPRLRKVAAPSTTEATFQAAHVELQTQNNIANDGLQTKLTAVIAERDKLFQERETWIRERSELLEASGLLKTKAEDLANENSAFTLANTALTEENSGLKAGYEKVKLLTVALYDEVSVLVTGNDVLRRSNAAFVDENTALWANDERHQNSLFVAEEAVRTLRGENESLMADLTRKTAELAAAEARSAAEVRSLEAIERVLKERDTLKANSWRIVHIKEEPTPPSHAALLLPIVVDPTSAETRHNDLVVSPTTCLTVPKETQFSR